VAVTGSGSAAASEGAKPEPPTDRLARDRVVRYFLGLPDGEKAAFLVGLAMATDPKRLPTRVVARLIPETRTTPCP